MVLLLVLSLVCDAHCLVRAGVNLLLLLLVLVSVVCQHGLREMMLQLHDAWAVCHHVSQQGPWLTRL